MDSGESMTFTVLILLLLLIIVMFACHYLGPRATTWMRSNREEKIGLSKNKLFHSNGYMLPSGSAFLLSASGSFKRFDIAEKDDKEKSAENLSTTNATTPFWNIAQQESEIPPQPLRPAPEPGRTLTFKLSKLDEISSGRSMEDVSEDIFVPCQRFPVKNMVSSQSIKIEAPPPPRLFSSMAATNGTTAIPRPMARRHLSQDKFHEENHQTRHQLLTRRNSSTNPFLCDSIDSVTSEGHKETPHTALNSNGSHVSKLSKLAENNAPSDNNATNVPKQGPELNPFLEETESNNTTSNDHKIRALSKRRNTTANAADSESPSTVSFESRINANLTTIGNKFRGRSFSEAGWSADSLLSDIKKSAANPIGTNGLEKAQTKSNPFAGLAQKAKGPHMLQKTFSEDFLFRKIAVNSLGSQSNNSANGENGSWSFGRSMLRQNSLLSLGRRNSSQGSLDSNGSVEELERAISCDSVNSDSVFLCDLDQPYTQITGHLCIGLHYDNVLNEGFDLLITVKEAKGLTPPFSVDSFDTFVRIYLVPDSPGALQTQVFLNSQAPYYNETFRFWLHKQNTRHSLWFHVYHNGESHTLIGEAEMEIHEAPRTITAWIPLTDSRKRNAQWGELMFSLSYLPTAERLTIVIVKARNLKLEIDPNLKGDTDIPPAGNAEIQSIFVKAYLMNNERNMQKKRTSLKRRDRSLTFNESMIFSVPPQGLATVQLRLTVYGIVDSTTILPLGHVIAGSCATGKGLRHWHQMLSSLRKPVSMWHVLRRATNQPVFTGGAEAVVAALQSTSLRAKRNSVI